MREARRSDGDSGRPRAIQCDGMGWAVHSPVTSAVIVPTEATEVRHGTVFGHGDSFDPPKANLRGDDFQNERKSMKGGAACVLNE